MRKLILASFVVLAGCGILDPDDRRDDLADARRRWDSLNIVSYEYVLQRSCFCPIETVRPYRVRVLNGAVVDARDVETGAAPPAGLPILTIPELFAVIEDALDQSAYSLEVDYDAQRGYPVRIAIDYDRQTADEELGFRASEFLSLE